jgi:hypothetical protein
VVNALKLVSPCVPRVDICFLALSSTGNFSAFAFDSGFVSVGPFADSILLAACQQRLSNLIDTGQIDQDR